MIFIKYMGIVAFIQTRQQEREPLAPVPDQRWVILAGEGLILQKNLQKLVTLSPFLRYWGERP